MAVGGKLSDIAWDNASRATDDNIFTPEFYGGADVRVYIGGKRYKNISSIQVSIREQQKPIYGYASRIYDDIAHGTRIVQGAIRVPVSNEGPKTKAEKQRAIEKESNNTMQNIDIPSWAYNSKNNYAVNDENNSVAKRKNEKIRITNENLYLAPSKNSKVIKTVSDDYGEIILEKENFLFVNINGRKGFICKT